MKNTHSPHRLIGGLISIFAGIALAVLMFLPRFIYGGMAIGIVLLLLIGFGVLAFFNAIQVVSSPSSPQIPTPPSTDLSGQPGWLRFLAGFHIQLLYTGLALIAAGACRVSVIGTLGASAPWSGPLLIGFGAAIIGLARLRRKPFDGNLHERFLVLSLAAATLMATLGSHGLWDCWETHYGELARRQLEQDDWISLFWESKWFYSKPILIFWLMNIGLALFGVHVAPDRISDHAEWGVRFMVGALALAVIAGVYELIARRVSKRAGVFVALVLGTMPLFGFMARQAITDLPFVGFMTLAVVFFLFGITAQKDAELGAWHLPLGKQRRLKLTGFHGVILTYILVGVPQFLYLATRNDRFVWGTFGRNDVRIVTAKERLTDVHLSDFFDVSGFLSKFLQVSPIAKPDISLDWFITGMGFLIVFGLMLFSLRRERRISRLCFHAMYICLGLSVMAKGLAGLVIPMLGLAGFWLVTAPLRDMAHPWRFITWHIDKVKQLDLVRGVPAFLCVSAPWFVAMVLRHSNAFVNRFFIHDHIKRLSAGVHGERGTLQYFVQQFGYAAFPWVALLPFALLAWPRIRDLASQKNGTESPRERNLRLIRLFTACWATLCFALLCFMTTKFHHYVFPLVPPTALLIGLLLDDIWTGRVKKIGAVVVVGVGIVALVGWDLMGEPNRTKGVLEGYAQLVGLFIYKYSRPYPEGDAFDFSGPLFGFSLLFVLLLIGWLVSKKRRAMIVATAIAALVFSHWTNQHYMIALAPHWTQKHLVAEYYKRRNSPSERLVAFQMNWKGENFYTGNRAVIHVSTKNKNFEKWVDAHRGQRHFFITEHKRYDRMSARAKAASGPLVHLPDLCNKYRAGFADKL
ncbi:MAG: glycosyltransferase family 39 protein [Myxococcota bacterium]|nr:glycosyltransferase family 39 protein [Myxococcota bacterium]